jgi:hypothetical protein
VVACCSSHHRSATRSRIPRELIDAYFEQEHFSLKRLVKRYSSKENSLTIVHTRSDQYIHRIPGLSADRSNAYEATDAIDIVSKFVHELPHELIVEHLSRLRSEASIRGAIRVWSQHEIRNVFLLLVDMSAEGALDRGTS